MAQLSADDRLRVWRGLMRYWSALHTEIELSKSQLQDAVNTTDIWIDNNQSAYNSALPSIAQANLSTTQKTLLFCAVALARVSINALRKLFGEVN